MVQELGENRSARVHSPFLHFTYFPSAKAVFDSSDFKSTKTTIAFNSLPCIALAESLKPSSGQYCSDMNEPLTRWTSKKDAGLTGRIATEISYDPSQKKS